MLHTLPDRPECWPPLPLAGWRDTYDTLHLWTQIVGQVRMNLTPPLNHYWHVPYYVTARGLTTSRIPYKDRAFELYFDFIRHQLVLETSDGITKSLPLAPRSVADFFTEFRALLQSVNIQVKISPLPMEIPNPIPFDQDRVHSSYDAKSVEAFWRILLSVDAVLQAFRGEFIGKSSPVHFFWGSFDLALTRFSGRRAPARPGADPVTTEAYSHEESSVGFWPGSGNVQDPAFYSYAAPAPEGFAQASVLPPQAHYDSKLGEFILMYEDVRKSTSPSKTLLDFCHSTYEAAANLGHWDRAALER